MTFFTVLPSSALRLTGADRLDFVQGQMTNNLKAALTPGMVEACFLNPKGQIEFFARIYKRQDDVYLHLAAGEAPLLAVRFAKYIIFDQVEVQDLSAELATLHLWTTQLAGWQDSGPEVQNLHLGSAAVMVGRVNRSGVYGLDLHYLAKQHAEVLSFLSAAERPYTELEQARIQAGLSNVTEDGWAGYLPQEVGLEGAMSYQKGCYVGQEIMARLSARGNTRYHLTQLEGVNIPPRTDILAAGKAVGRTGSSTGAMAVARLRKDLAPHTALEIGGVSAQVVG